MVCKNRKSQGRRENTLATPRLPASALTLLPLMQNSSSSTSRIVLTNSTIQWLPIDPSRSPTFRFCNTERSSPNFEKSAQRRNGAGRRENTLATPRLPASALTFPDAPQDARCHPHCVDAPPPQPFLPRGEKGDSVTFALGTRIRYRLLKFLEWLQWRTFTTGKWF